MDPRGWVHLGDHLTMDTDGQQLQGVEAVGQPACPDQAGLHTQLNIGDNWDDLVSRILLPNESLTELLSQQPILNESKAATAIPYIDTSNHRAASDGDPLQILSSFDKLTGNETFNSSSDNRPIFPRSLKTSNACEAKRSEARNSSANRVKRITAAADISPGHPNTTTAQQLYDAAVANGYVPRPKFDKIHLDFYKGAKNANGNAASRQKGHEISDANDSMRHLAVHNHHDGTLDNGLVFGPTQQYKQLDTPGDDPVTLDEKQDVSETHTLHHEDDFYYDPKTVRLYSMGNSSVQEGPVTEQQNLSTEEMEAILQKRVFIDEGDKADEPGAKRQRVEDVVQESQGRQDPDGILENPKPPFVVLGRSREGNFWFETIKVYSHVVCDHCDQPFPFQKLLEAHIRSKHAEKRKKRTYRKRQRSQVHQCDTCQSTLKNAANLKRHKAIVHGGKIVAFCADCDNAPFSSKHGFTLHRRDKHKVVPASVEKRFGSNVYEERALKKQYSSSDNINGWLVHSCTSCGYWSEGKGNTQRHIRITHMGLREFPCKYCPMQFKTKSNRDLHCLSKHPEKGDADGTGNLHIEGDSEIAEEGKDVQ